MKQSYVTDLLEYPEDVSRLKLGGIYAIIIGDRYYIGSTCEFVGRFRTHSSDLKTGKHRNKFLQFVYNKHRVLRFQIIEVIKNPTKQSLIWVEQAYLDLLYRDKCCMNLMGRAETGGQACRKVICDGVTYNSVSAVASKFGVPATNVSSWLSGKMAVSHHFEIKELRYADELFSRAYWKKKLKPVLVNGTRFDSLTEAASSVGVSVATVHNWLAGRSPIPLRYNITDLRYESGDNVATHRPIARPVIVNGQIFKTSRDAARHIGCFPTQLHQWLSGNKPIPKHRNIFELRYA